MTVNTLLAQAKAAGEAGKLKDQTEDNGGGNFEYEPPAAGPCMARLVSYIEIGPQVQLPFAGKAKKPSPECIVEFQLLGKKHAKEIEFEENGKTVKKTVYPIMRLGRGPSSKVGEGVKNGMNMPGGSRSNHYKLLQAMDYGRGNTNMAFMVGEAFKVEVVHNEVEREENGKKTKTVFANLRDADGNWKISAPVVQKFDDEGEPDGPPQPIKCMEPTVDLRMLLWDAPSIEQWDSIYIDGTFTKKVGETEVEVSKNWIQEQVLGSTAFEGSGIQTVLMESGGDLPKVSAEVSDEVPEVDLDDEIPDFGSEGGEGGSGTDTPDEGDTATGGDDSQPDAASDDPLAGLDFEQ